MNRYKCILVSDNVRHCLHELVNLQILPKEVVNLMKCILNILY